jgi:uncharacterized protein (TIGR00299 family) protein
MASRIHVGRGFVTCRHGRIPVPAPATLALLKGIPIYSTGIENELTTPTGAAILSTLAERFGDLPEMRTESIGYGAGSRELEIPNMLRLVIGESGGDEYDTDEITLIETNIDDMNPQIYDYLIDRLFENGALDVNLIPTFMKKQRPSVILSILAPDNKVNDMAEIIFAETTTLGIRLQKIRRKKLKRELRTIDTEYGPATVKITWAGGKINNITPEYDDCKNIAADTGMPLKNIIEEIRKYAREKVGKGK